LTLTALSAHVVEAASLMVPLVRSKVDEQGRLIDAAFAAKLTEVVAALVRATEQVNLQA
jgi:hypothetical protein